MPIMKKPTISRKHGLRARLEAAQAARFRVNPETDTREVSASGSRLKTTLTFSNSSQAYLWITDRGRSRLLKH